MTYKVIKNTYKDLAINESTRADLCPSCGKKGCFSIVRTTTQLAYQCFSCKISGYINMTKPTLQQRKLYKEMQQEHTVAELPYDYTTLLPNEAKIFMMKYALDDKQLSRNNIGYSPHREMFVYPVHYKGELKAVQYRLLYNDPDMPKYITHGDKAPYVINHATSDDVVLTEDILSAIKVSKYTNAICLLGTSLTFRHLKELIDGKYKRIFIWLDPDKAGVDGRRKIAKELSIYGFKPIVLKSEGDPKETFYKDIEEKLK